MSWFDQILWPALALVSIIFTVLLSVSLATWLTSRQLRLLEEELTTKIRRLSDRIAEQRRPTYDPAPREQNIATYPVQTYALPLDQSAEHPAVADGYPQAPSIFSQQRPPANVQTGQDDAAAAALTDRESFRAFAERHGGAGYALRSGGSVTAAPDAEFGADLWAISCSNGLLVYPGYNLRRTQSSLVADSGRVAEERLGWLYDIETGPSLRAIRPALVANDWSVTKRGILQVPF